MILEIRDGNNTAGDLVKRSGLKTVDLAKNLNVDRSTISRWKREKTDVCLGVYFKLVNYLHSVGKLVLEGEYTGFSLDTESENLNNLKEFFDVNMVSISSYAKYIKATPTSICKLCLRNKDPLSTNVSRYISVLLFTNNELVNKNKDLTFKSSDVNNFKVKILHDRVKGRRIKDINNNPYIKGTDANLKMMGKQVW